MRRLLLIVALLVAIAAPAAAQFSTTPFQVRTACASGCDVTDDFTDGTMQVTGLSTPTVGRCWIMWSFIGHTTRTFVLPNDGSNSFDMEESPSAASGRSAVSAAYISSATTTITQTLSAGSALGGDYLRVEEHAGCANPATFDTAAAAANTGNSAAALTVGTVTPSTAHSMLLAAARCTSGTYTNDADFTSSGQATVSGLVAFAFDVFTSIPAAQSWSLDPNGANETCAMVVAPLQGTAAGGVPKSTRFNFGGVGL